MIRSQKIKTYLVSIGLSFASVLICFVLIESYLTYHYGKVHDQIAAAVGSRDLCTTYSEFPELIYTRKPGACDANSHGFRDFEYDYNKPDGVFRIVIIGDSVAMGQGVEIRDGFGKVLERNLNEAMAGEGRKVEVIVLSQSGYATSQELFLLEHDAYKYSPDLILWSYVLNDPAHPVYHNSNGELGRYYFKPRLYTTSFIAKKLFEINEGRKRLDCPEDYFALLHCVYWDQVVSNIDRIGEIAAKKGIPIIFVIHPLFEEGGEFGFYSLATLHARLRGAATAAGLPVIDLLSAYQPYTSRELALPPDPEFDPLHPNAKGHRLAADYIGQFLTDQGLLH